MTADRKVAIVTGANRGLGFETCRQLGQRSIRVVLTSRDPAKGEPAAAKLHDEGLDVAFQQLDVTDPHSRAALAEFVRRELGHIDILVNNAGVALSGFNADVARKTLAVNFFGVIGVTDTLLPIMGREGRIVIVSSGMGELAGLSRTLRKRFDDPRLTRNSLQQLIHTFVSDVEAGRYRKQGWPESAYRVSKVGVNAFTRLLARELRDTNICVNAVCPGWVRTDMGGASASRSPMEGAEGIVWAATLASSDMSGGFYRDGKSISW